jgi:hypothetical protein
MIPIRDEKNCINYTAKEKKYIKKKICNMFLNAKNK